MQQDEEDEDDDSQVIFLRFFIILHEFITYYKLAAWRWLLQLEFLTISVVQVSSSRFNPCIHFIYDAYQRPSSTSTQFFSFADDIAR